jgi:hypothetical protein
VRPFDNRIARIFFETFFKSLLVLSSNDFWLSIFQYSGLDNINTTVFLGREERFKNVRVLVKVAPTFERGLKAGI